MIRWSGARRDDAAYRRVADEVGDCTACWQSVGYQLASAVVGALEGCDGDELAAISP